MVSYKNTATYRELLLPRDTEVAELTAHRNQLARTLDDRKLTNAAATKKKDIKPTAQMEKALAAGERALADAILRRKSVLDLKLKLRHLVKIVMEIDETIWTPSEVALWYKKLARNEGPGEEALKLRFDIPVDATYKPGDLIKYVDGVRVMHSEVKAIDAVVDQQEHDDPEKTDSIQTGSQGRHAFLRWHGMLTDEIRAKIPEHLLDSVLIGEITQSRLPCLPSDIRLSISIACAPSKSLGKYDVVYATTRRGYIAIPQSACNDAWVLESITKAGPKYILSEDYLRRRIRKSALNVSTSDSQNQTNVAAQQAL